MNGVVHPLSNCNFCPNALLHAAPQNPRERGMPEQSATAGAWPQKQEIFENYLASSNIACDMPKTMKSN